MISARFDTESLTRLRFAISPMFEVTRSAKALKDPAARRASPALDGAGAAEARGTSTWRRCSRCRTLPSTTPTSSTRRPSSPLVEFEDELETMLATPDEQIVAEVRYAYRDERLPAVLEPFVAEPRAAIEDLAMLMRDYWERGHAEHWPRMRSLLEHDVLYRSRQIADGGTARLFCDLDEGVTLARRRAATSAEAATAMLDLDERGPAADAERVRVAQGHRADGGAVAADAGLPGAGDRDAVESRGIERPGRARAARGAYPGSAAQRARLAALDDGTGGPARAERRRRLTASRRAARRGPRVRPACGALGPLPALGRGRRARRGLRRARRSRAPSAPPSLRRRPRPRRRSSRR